MTESHAFTFFIRSEENVLCEWCHKLTEKPKVAILPMMKKYNGEVKQFHLDCAIQLLAIMSGNNDGMFDWLILQKRIVQK